MRLDQPEFGRDVEQGLVLVAIRPWPNRPALSKVGYWRPL
jgi:hypothetical protein